MILREYDIGTGQARHLPTPGKCIYCGATDVELTDEHVIPYAIGKDATILDKACCKVCQKIIQPYEQAVLKKQLGVFRAMIEAPTRRKRDRPTRITLPIVEVDELGNVLRDLGSREIPIEDAPLILSLWQSPPPRILNQAIDPACANGRPWRYVESKVMDPILEKVAKETNSAHVAIKLEAVNRQHYLRSLAKTAHAFVAAEFGVDAFEPFLTDLILKKSDDLARYVGDQSGVASLEGATGHDFKITVGEVFREAGAGTGLIAVFMQLWGDLGSPSHIVIVGKMLSDMDAHFQNPR
jgi:hypothetical protein